MKKVIALLFTTFLVLCFAGTVSATLFSFCTGDDCPEGEPDFFLYYDTNDIVLDADDPANNSETFTIDLDKTTDVGAEDDILWAVYAMDVDDATDDASASLSVNGGEPWVEDDLRNFPPYFIGITDDLDGSHVADITITATDGSFRVDQLAIAGKYCDVPAPVPEPPTMLLLGSGLIGLSGLVRRRLKKS
jgi:hypothetical protein